MNTLTPSKNLAATLAICVTFSSALFAQDEELEEVLEGEALPGDMVNPYEADGTKTVDMDALAEEMNNPLSELWFLAIQNDTTTYTGDFDGGDSRTFNNLKLQPVMSFPLTEDYNMVLRPPVQVSLAGCIAKRTPLAMAAAAAATSPAGPSTRSPR